MDSLLDLEFFAETSTAEQAQEDAVKEERRAKRMQAKEAAAKQRAAEAANKAKKKQVVLFTDEDVAATLERFAMTTAQAERANEENPKILVDDYRVTEGDATVDDKISGSILGLAWGDALGCPVEGYRTRTIKAAYSPIATDDSDEEDKADAVADDDNDDTAVEAVPATESETTSERRHVPSFSEEHVGSLYAPHVMHYKELPYAYDFERLKRLGVKVMKKLRPFGLHSDDTQQAMALISCCMSEDSPANDFSREKWASWLVAGRDTKAWRGIGRNFTAALDRLCKGVSPYESGSPSSGIGSAMRIGPIGALYLNASIDKLAEVCYGATMTTHSSILGSAMTFAVAYTVRQFILGKSATEIRQSLPEVVSHYERQWHEMRPAVNENPTAVSQAMTQVFQYIDELQSEMKQDTPNWYCPPNSPNAASTRVVLIRKIRSKISSVAQSLMPNTFIRRFNPNQGPVLLGGVHALSMALLDDVFLTNSDSAHQANPNEVLLDLINVGYDTDTVAAICGTMLGARFGTKWIPVHRLQDAAILTKYAQAVIAHTGVTAETPVTEAPETCEEYMRRESTLTASEKTYQKDIVRRWCPKPVKGGTAPQS